MKVQWQVTRNLSKPSPKIDRHSAAAVSLILRASRHVIGPKLVRTKGAAGRRAESSARIPRMGLGKRKVKRQP